MCERKKSNHANAGIAQLASWAKDAFFKLETGARPPDVPELPPDSDPDLAELRAALHRINEHLAGERPLLVTDVQQSQGVHDASRAHQIEERAPPKDEHVDKALEISKKRPPRRASSTAFNYAILEALRHRREGLYNHPVGQATLLSLVREIDPLAKKTSLISQLGRWRNDDDKKWVEWSNHEDLKLTQKGDSQLTYLSSLMLRDQQSEQNLDKVRAAFSAVLHIELQLEKLGANSAAARPLS